MLAGVKIAHERRYSAMRMIRSVALGGLACFAVPVWAQQSEPEGLLSKIQDHVRESLARLPNYTCTELIQRLQSSNNPKNLPIEERFRVEVAYVDGGEFFGWPGTGKIDQPQIGKLVEGTIGDGYFALFSQGIFATNATRFHYVGTVALAAKTAIQYDYSIPKEAKIYRIGTEVGQAWVGFHGSVWMENGSLDLMRITVAADDPPQALGIVNATSMLDFEKAKVGSSEFTLPRAAELSMAVATGYATKSLLSFESCHQFVGESVLKFESSDPQPGQASAIKLEAAPVSLPDDFTVVIALNTPVDSESSATGDPVSALVVEPIRIKRSIIVPKGARLSGRIRHLTKSGDDYKLDLLFTDLQFDNKHADIDGRRNVLSYKEKPLFFHSEVRLGRGARLTWRSLLLKSVQ